MMVGFLTTSSSATFDSYRVGKFGQESGELFRNVGSLHHNSCSANSCPEQDRDATSAGFIVPGQNLHVFFSVNFRISLTLCWT